MKEQFPPTNPFEDKMLLLLVMGDDPAKQMQGYDSLMAIASYLDTGTPVECPHGFWEAGVTGCHVEAQAVSSTSAGAAVVEATPSSFVWADME